MKRVAHLLGLVVVASIALTGCSKKEDAKLAEFKDRSITVAKYVDAYAKVDAAYLPRAEGEEGKLEFLKTMLHREMMAFKADELGYDKDPTVSQGLEGITRMTTQVAYLRKNVEGKYKVTDADVKRHYDLMGTTINMKQILTDTPEQAKAAYDALKSGQDFETTARQYSKADDAAEGGVILTASYGTLILELQEPLFNLPVGGFTEPILTPHGFVIAKVLKIDPPAKKAFKFEDVKDNMYEEVRRARENMAVNAFTEKLREDYGVTWHWENMELVFDALPADRPFEEAPARNQEVYPLLYFDAGDLDKPLVSYPARTITIKDFSDLYDQASFFNRPRKQTRVGGIRGFLMSNVMNEISFDAVKKSGIENDPEVKAILKAKQEELMVNLLYEDMVNKQTVVTEEMMLNYYNDNTEAFHVAERRKFGVVVAGDIETAQQVQEELRSGRPVAAVAAAYSIDETTRDNQGLTGEVGKGENPEFDGVGFAMRRLGEVSEPFQTSKGWMVLKLVEMMPARVFSFEEAKGRIEPALRERENERRLDELLAKWTEELGVVIHEDRLAKVALPERSTEPRTGHEGHSH